VELHAFIIILPLPRTLGHLLGRQESLRRAHGESDENRGELHYYAGRNELLPLDTTSTPSARNFRGDVVHRNVMYFV
jgi:hypothetical protein